MSSPPMEMDDPATPGPQGIEVNLVGTMLRAGPQRGSESLLDANYGVGDRLQLKLERAYLTERAPGLGSQQGLGATEFGVKWRFVESGGLEVAMYPQYAFDDAFRRKDENGDLEEGEGPSVYFPLLLSKAVGRTSTLAANVGYRRNLKDRGDDIDLALGIGRAMSKNWRLLVEVFSERDEHLMNRQTDVRVGYAGVLLPRFWMLELGGFASVGRSIGATEEGERSTSVVLGVSMVKDPKGE